MAVERRVWKCMIVVICGCEVIFVGVSEGGDSSYDA